MSVPDPIVTVEGGPDLEQQVPLADSVGLALQVVIDTLAPAERLAFVLDDLFDLPFEEIAPMVGRTSEATRQLASRARRRVKAPRHLRQSVISPGASRGGRLLRRQPRGRLRRPGGRWRTRCLTGRS